MDTTKDGTDTAIVPQSGLVRSGGILSTQFFPNRVQPIAGKAIAAMRVVYLELYRIVESVMNSVVTYNIDNIVNYSLTISYLIKSSYLKSQFLQDFIFHIKYLTATSGYRLDRLACTLIIYSLITCISDVLNVKFIRQRCIYSNIEAVLDVQLVWISLRAAIRTTIALIANLEPLDCMLMREGKLIIRVLAAYLDKLSKNFGRIVIKEDPFI